MNEILNSHLNCSNSKSWAKKIVFETEVELAQAIQKRTDEVLPLLQKVLNAFAKRRLSSQHFSSSSGYGHNDIGRDVIDDIFADIFDADKAAVRSQFVSGTHAITSALFGVLRPGDNILSVTGEPYETLQEVIGTRGSRQGSLIDFGISYDQISVLDRFSVDLALLEKALNKRRHMIFIQRSCGYSWRKSLSISDIKEICTLVHEKQPDCICFVDNCYGEFIESREPCSVGADLIAGSLIKNPGGTLPITGGYVAGRSNLVEQACCRLTAPGIGSNGGITFNMNRLILQGIFLAPQMVSEALIGSDLVAAVFNKIGFEVMPGISEARGDVIQAVQLGSDKALKLVCRAFQKSSPVDSFLDPVPGEMPGYENNLIMSGGTFVEGSTSEFSADAPVKPPYNLFVQGGTHRAHVKIALIEAINELIKADLINLDQNI